MDIYHSPKEFGLEQVCFIDYSDGCYRFDLRVVWRHKDSGALYTARDAGCSCPYPFEHYRKIEDLEEYSYEYLRSEALEESRKKYYSGDSVSDFIDGLPR